VHVFPFLCEPRVQLDNKLTFKGFETIFFCKSFPLHLMGEFPRSRNFGLPRRLICEYAVSASLPPTARSFLPFCFFVFVETSTEIDYKLLRSCLRMSFSCCPPSVLSRPFSTLQFPCDRPLYLSLFSYVKTGEALSPDHLGNVFFPISYRPPP